MQPLKQHTPTERRSTPRKPYARYIFFATRNRFFQGELKNYSRHGLFIETRYRLEVGDVITVALPFLNDRRNKFRAQVVRSSGRGIGVEFFRDPAKRRARKDLI
jgi:hypothetical protein